MQFNILMPYRPLCMGGRASPAREMHQLPDGSWMDDHNNILTDDSNRQRVSLRLTLDALQRNSFYEHKIKVIIDHDVFPNENFLKEYKNVEILKSTYVPPEDADRIGVGKWWYRLPAADKVGIDSVPDDEWLCYSYVADLICCKNWDKLIVDAIGRYGDKVVYVPMFVEIKGGSGERPWCIIGTEPTPIKIWRDWRKEMCCHGLTIPDPGTGYMTEAYFEHFMEISNKAQMGYIMEDCGTRQYGYYNILVMKAKLAKSVGIMIGPGFDLDFDNRLRDIGNYKKVVVTNSFILHNHFVPFYWTEEEARKEGIRSIYSPDALEALKANTAKKDPWKK
jgi:hypothetical protein